MTVEIELHALDPELEGASFGSTRIYSEVGTFFDLHFHPIDENGNKVPRTRGSTRLAGKTTISKYKKAGDWLSGRIGLRDLADNVRHSSPKDFGWRMYVNNASEDVSPPEYVTGSLEMSKSVWEEDSTVQLIRITWSFEEDTALADPWGCHAIVIASLSDTYSKGDYGTHGDDLCTVEIKMPNYMPSSAYSVVRVSMVDLAGNWAGENFTGDDATETPPSVDLVTTNPDTEPPEIDINRISVDAEPTIPDAPNGETRVTVGLRFRDDISGVSTMSMYLRDPQGGTHYYPLYVHYLDDDESEHGLYPGRDPSKWAPYEKVVILPPGSLPGTWGIAEIGMSDRAGNDQRYNFVEIIHFDVDGDG